MNIPVGRAVHAFMDLMGQPTPPRPVLLTAERMELRAKLIDEEYDELTAAFVEGDLAGFLDACVDLVYVIVGTAVEAGMPFDKAFDMVHRANMSKATTCLDCVGKGTIPTELKNHAGNPIRERCEECNGRGVKVIYREDGKVMKPVDWTAPDIQSIIEEASARVEGE